MIVVRRGYALPVSGGPEQRISGRLDVARVAVLAADHLGLRARVLVEEGARVRRGEPLFEDRKNPGVRFTAPGAGVISRVARGAKRALVSIEIALSPTEREGTPRDDELVTFATEALRTVEQVRAAPRRDVVALLLESGLFSAFRARPFSKIPPVDATPDALFVTAIDTHPLAVDPSIVVEDARDAFVLGLEAVAKLPSGKTFLCVARGSSASDGVGPGVHVEEFAGPHPAGLPGTHIHFLHPVGRKRVVWHVGYQDVIAIGRLLATGTLPVERVLSLAGPALSRPRVVRARLGASVDDLLAAEELPQDVRRVSGSVLSGRMAAGDTAFLGRYHLQVSVLREGRERELLGWLAPGRDKVSTIPAFLSSLLGRRRRPLTTSTHGSRRAMVPIGMYERVMPLDILPTFLLRALAVRDVERAEELGALELDEEDLDLCSFVCPGKISYGPILRENLDLLEAAG